MAKISLRDLGDLATLGLKYITHAKEEHGDVVWLGYEPKLEDVEEIMKELLKKF